MKNGTKRSRRYAAGVITLALIGLGGWARGAETADRPAIDCLEYAVYADGLDLRAEPSLQAKVLAVQAAGAVVKTNVFVPAGNLTENSLHVSTAPLFYSHGVAAF
jgi:hypothetical protein